MKKAMSLILCLIMVMGSFTAIPLVASAAEEATVYLYGIGGVLQETKTLEVGDEFTVYVALNCSDIQNGYICSLSAEQQYTDSVLEEIDEMTVEGENITFTNLDEVFPVTKASGTLANTEKSGRIIYNASTPFFNAKAFNFNTDASLLIVTKYRVIAPGEAYINNIITTLACADNNMTIIISRGNVLIDDFTCDVTFTEPVLDILGDVNGDGDVDVLDATLIQRSRVGYSTGVSEEELQRRGDINGDNAIDVTDATLIQRHRAGYDIGYPIGEPII